MITEKVKRWLRFLVTGVLNTLFSYGVYVALCLAIDYQIAYFFAYAAGVVFSFYLNSLYVFRVATTWAGFLRFPIVYIAQYICSALLLKFLVVDYMIDKFYAPILVSGITLPITYILSKFALNTKNRIE